MVCFLWVGPASRRPGTPLAPVLRGEGSGVRGALSRPEDPLTPTHPQPLSPEYGGAGAFRIDCAFAGPSRTTLNGPTSGNFSPPTVRSRDRQVNEFASIGVSSVVAVTLSPSAVTAAAFATHPFSVR